MSIQRWDPWRDIMSLREAMNSLFEENFVQPRGQLASGMAVDVRETDDAYVVETLLPGAKPEDVNISVMGDALRISAQIDETEEQKDAKWILRERRFGAFERTMTLPSPVQADEAEASFEDGILKITLPKSEAARPQQIQVRKAVEAGSTSTSNS